MIGLKLQSRIHADHIEIWQPGRKLFEMPRLIGKDQVWFDYRHVIDSLVRKPGGFINYRYREHMYPTIWFRKAFDTAVAQQGEHGGIKCYLKLLYLAKHHGQENVEIELRLALESAATIDPKLIESKIDKTSPASLVEDPHVEQPELDTYDDLLKYKEVLDEHDAELSDNRATELATEPRGSGWPFETTEIADDAIVSDQPCGPSGAGAMEPSAVLERVDDSRNGPTHRESHFEALEEIGSRTQQDMVSDQVVPFPDGGTPYDDGCGDRSASSSQHDNRAQRWQLPPGRSSSQTESPSGPGITNTACSRGKISPKPVGKFSCR